MTRFRPAAYYAGVLFSTPVAEICIALLHSFIAKEALNKSDGSGTVLKKTTTPERASATALDKPVKTSATNRSRQSRVDRDRRKVNKRTMNENMQSPFHPNAATNRQNAVTGLMEIPVDMKFVTTSVNFAILQCQFDELRKLIEQRNAEIADLKAKLAKAQQG